MRPVEEFIEAAVSASPAITHFGVAVKREREGLLWGASIRSPGLPDIFSTAETPERAASLAYSFYVSNSFKV